jgi:hypothetical protein
LVLLLGVRPRLNEHGVERQQDSKLIQHRSAKKKVDFNREKLIAGDC